MSYNNDKLGSAPTVAHAVDRFLFAVVWPHILADVNECNV